MPVSAQLTRFEKPCFTITLHTHRSGTVQHVIQSSCEETAYDRLKAAYPGQDLRILDVRKSIGYRTADADGSMRLKGGPKK